jgi:hypothetical protein
VTRPRGLRARTIRARTKAARVAAAADEFGPFELLLDDVSDFVERETALALAELDAPTGAKQAPVLEGRIIGGEVVLDPPPAASRRRRRK